MRIVLSRKGFDSTYGGYPSPILPDGTLLSLPIPSPGDRIHYAELQSRHGTYLDLMQQLKPSINIPTTGRHLLDKSIECHLDPDLISETIPRLDPWRPLFGQINQAQSHLENQHIGPGDVFLFFGWFRQAEWQGKQLVFTPGAADLHIIFGYLQIDRLLHPRDDQVEPWMQYHPHLINPARCNQKSNCLYIARQHLSWDETRPGAACLKFTDERVLTKSGQTRSVWILPLEFQSLSISYHSAKSWREDGSFHSARIGQEFVIEDNVLAERWAQQIIAPDHE